ncbi:MAG: hypothetical protein L6R19_07335 [Alphaproteobacteria bacterium]|nr:hypothetical protein [Alphaproteobacteria bacterium]
MRLSGKAKQRKAAAKKPRDTRMRKALKDLRAGLAKLEALPADVGIDRRRFTGRWLPIEVLVPKAG